MILFVYSLGVFLINKQLRENFHLSNFSQEHSIPASSSNNLTNNIVIDVEESVTNPRIYCLKSEGRVVDGLIPTGGLAVSADRVWVVQQFSRKAFRWHKNLCSS